MYTDNNYAWKCYISYNNYWWFNLRLLIYGHSIARQLLFSPLQWHHDGCDGISNHWRLGCILNSLSQRRSKKISKLHPLAFVRGIHWWPMNSPHKGPVTRKMLPFDDVIMHNKPTLCTSITFVCTRYCQPTCSRGTAMTTFSQWCCECRISKSSLLLLLLPWCLEHIEAETKWTPLGRRYFQMHFLEWKCKNFDWNVIKVCC